MLHHNGHGPEIAELKLEITQLKRDAADRESFINHLRGQVADLTERLRAHGERWVPTRETLTSAHHKRAANRA